ncbi:unnamed protein product [Clavelina lepadiformis]|uniref:Tetratricopeptide repeat protein 29 n=1 Tax=Clavelina lepadiformis TaxID=159417 RepID=A0ABP0FZ25_CLALP
MTTLPAIGKGNENKRSSARSRGSSQIAQRSTRFMTWRDRETLKHQKIREEMPTMTKVDTSVYRNSYKHNLCIQMLKEGFHKSFEELFSLIEQRKQERLEAGIDSVLWQEKPLDVQEEKLDQLLVYLTKAEAATRSGKWEEVYSCRHKLAQYFLETGDGWLSDHFFKTALETSLNIRLDGRKREAEAHCNMGLSCERNGDHEGASRHLEQFHQLSVGRAWRNDDDITHCQTACRHLSRVYTTLAESNPSVQTCQSFLHKAYEMAKEGDDVLQIAQAALKLGRNYEQMRDSETAMEYLKSCLEAAQAIEDQHLIGEACEALAKSHQTQGNVNKSIEFLELFVETSRSDDRKREFIDACNCLGTIYNTLGYYEKSVNHYTSAYETSNEIEVNNEESSVLLGVAKGNQLLNDFKGNMEIPEPYMMARIVGWKDERINDFGKTIPAPQVRPPPSPEKVPDPTQPYREADPEKALSYA